MKIIVKWPLCDGNGNCAQAAPELFHLDEDDALHVTKEELGREDLPHATAAVKACPKHALRLVD